MIQKKSLKDAIQNPEIISVVGGLLPEATNENKGLMSTYKSQYSNILIQPSAGSTRYVKIASIHKINTEGVYSHLSALIIGGNNYVGHTAVSIVSLYDHMGSMKTTINKLIGVNNIGYVKNGDSIDIYVQCVSFNHFLRIIPLSLGQYTILSNEVVSNKPSGWIDIQ